MTKLLKPKEVSSLLQLHYNRVLDLIKLGELKAVQIGKSYRISEYDLNEFINKHRVKSHF